MKIKSALRGSEKTAPNILFKKLNIIYKSIFHKQFFIYIYISTWKFYYKGDTSFAHTDPPVKTNFTLSMWSYCHRSWGSAQTQLRTYGHQVWLYLIHVKSTHQQPETNIPRTRAGWGAWVHCRVAKAIWPIVVQGLEHKSASWTSAQNEGSCWLRYRTSCFSLSHFSFPFPSPRNPTQV